MLRLSTGRPLPLRPPLPRAGPTKAQHVAPLQRPFLGTCVSVRDRPCPSMFVRVLLVYSPIVRRLVFLALFLVPALALVSHAWPSFRARSLPTGEAQWIWKPLDRKDHNPTAFYAVRDFELKTPPEKARLLITADE